MEEEAGPEARKALKALLRHSHFVLKERGLSGALAVLGVGDEIGSVV